MLAKTVVDTVQVIFNDSPIFLLVVAHEDPKTGSVSVKGWQGKFGHTSFAQFWSNVVWGSMLLFRYRDVVEGIGLEEGWARSALFVFMFPFNVWWLEIVEGYILMFLFGRNVAWVYRGKSAYFHGTITIDYFVPWLGLGAVLELLWDSVILSLIKEVERSEAWVWIIAVASIVTLIFAPACNGGAVFRAIVGPKAKERGGKKAKAEISSKKTRSSSRARKSAKEKEEKVSKRGRSRTARSRSKGK